MLTLVLAALAFLGWLAFAVALCVIVAGASRGIEEPQEDGGERFGRGH